VLFSVQSPPPRQRLDPSSLLLCPWRIAASAPTHQRMICDKSPSGGGLGGSTAAQAKSVIYLKLPRINPPFPSHQLASSISGLRPPCPCPCRSPWITLSLLHLRAPPATSSRTRRRRRCRAVPGPCLCLSRPSSPSLLPPALRRLVLLLLLLRCRRRTPACCTCTRTATSGPRRWPTTKARSGRSGSRRCAGGSWCSPCSPPPSPTRPGSTLPVASGSRTTRRVTSPAYRCSSPSSPSGRRRFFICFHQRLPLQRAGL
jgi:hypothetical protein